MVNKILVAVGALLLLLSMSVFTVGVTERVIKFQLGEIVGTRFQHRASTLNCRLLMMSKSLIRAS